METSIRTLDKSYTNSRERAFEWGYEDGRSEQPEGTFTENLRLALLEDATERLEYYRGHRLGSQVRPAGADFSLEEIRAA